MCKLRIITRHRARHHNLGFLPVFVNELSPEQLEIMAGEDVVTKRKCAELKREIDSLEKGKTLL